ncbi:MAG: hypothetical protein O3A00_28120, partial [Planctomycetota bacterium]|nr:hypothetical protein [Planctomycetota bacterium]
MSRFKRDVRCRPSTAACLLAVCLMTSTLVGCNYVILLSYLIHGPPSIAPLFETETGKSMTDKDVAVAVVCYAPKEIKWDFENIDNELAKYVGYRLGEHNIKFVNPQHIQA